MGRRPINERLLENHRRFSRFLPASAHRDAQGYVNAEYEYHARHPKHPGDMEVSGDEIVAALKAYEGFQEQVMLYGNLRNA